MAAFHLGIDFGTSSTVACLRWPDGRTRPLLFDGSPMMPSAVYLADGRLLVGRDAQHSARVDPGRYEPNPKRRIDEGTVLLGSTEIPVTTLIGEVLRRVATETWSVTGGQPFGVTLAFPAAWGEHRRRTLLDAAAVAGLREPYLVPEPIAATSYFDAVVRDRARPAGNLVIYDLGAGTFDVSVVTRTPGGFDVRVSDGLGDMGGLDIDAAITAFLGAVADDEDARSVWARLDRPTTTSELRARRQLWDDVRTAKEMLSRSATTTIYVPLLERDMLLGREQFERLVHPLLDRTVGTTRSAIRRAGLAEGAPLDIFLVGGASRVPLIATLLHRATGVAPTTIEQPELAVAEGCLLVATAPPAQAPPAPPGPPGPPAPPASLTPPVQAWSAEAAPPVRATPPAQRPRNVVPEPPPSDAPPWTSLVQVIDLAVGENAGFTLRCYMPPEDPAEDPDAAFLTRDGQMLVFDKLGELVRYVRTDDPHDLTDLADWHQVQDGLNRRSAEEYTVEAYELDLIMANVGHGPREWSPELFVASRDLAVELGNALDLRPVLAAFGRGSLLDRVDDAMRAAQERRPAQWWKIRKLTNDEVRAARDSWRRVVSFIEATIWPSAVR